MGGQLELGADQRAETSLSERATHNQLRLKSREKASGQMKYTGTRARLECVLTVAPELYC